MFTQSLTIEYSALNNLGKKTQGVITDIINKDEKIIKKLLAMGVHKGMQITLEQRFPSFVIKVGRTRIAIDKNLAKSIRVRVISH